MIKEIEERFIKKVKAKEAKLQSLETRLQSVGSRHNEKDSHIIQED